MTRIARRDGLPPRAREIALAPSEGQRVSAEVLLPNGATARLDVAMTPAGLLAIGGMVGAMLLGSAAIVLAARRLK